MKFFKINEKTLNTAIAKKHRNPATRNELLQLAAMYASIETKKVARIILLLNNRRGSPECVEQLLATHNEIRELRSTRFVRRVETRIGTIPAAAWEVDAHRELSPPLRQRLNRLRINEVASVAGECIRRGAAGGTSIKVFLSSDPDAADYTIELTTNWDTYRGRFKGWSATEDHHELTVPRDWRIRVAKNGLAIIKNKMTLNAKLIAEIGEIKLYEATWANQGRGFSVWVEKGFIIDDNGKKKHFGSIEDARRKMESIQNRRHKDRAGVSATHDSKIAAGGGLLRVPLRLVVNNV